MIVRLKQLRKEKGWSQQETAVQLGISLDFVRSIEIGRAEPSLKTIRRIYNVFGCERIDQLLEAS